MDVQALKDKLTKLAKKPVGCDSEDWIAYETYGGNIDDAYAGGCDDGMIELARDLLAEFFPE